MFNRSLHYRSIFQHPGVWESLYPVLRAARTQQDVEHAFESVPRIGDVHEFVPALSALILKVVHDRRFPKKPEAQIGFFADSLAARGRVLPRRSRDICEEERAKARKVGRILRYEFFITCSCGYAGPAVYDGCPECGAQIVFDVSRQF